MSKQFRQWVPTLPDIGTVAGTELIPCVKGGVSSTMDAAELSVYVGKNPGIAGPSLNILLYGGDNTGASDNSAALALAFAALGAGGYYGGGTIFFPAGSYQFTSAVTLTLPSGRFNLALEGAGPSATTLWWSGATDGLIIDGTTGGQSNSLRVQGMTLMSNSPNTGTGITFKNTAFNADGALNITSIFRDLVFGGTDGLAASNCWATGIELFNSDNTGFDNCFFLGNTSHQGTGVALLGDAAASSLSVVFNFMNCNWVSLAVGLSYGTWVQGVTVVNSNFTGCAIGINIPTGGLGFLGQLAITNSQFGMNTAGAIAINMVTVVNNLLVQGNLFISDGDTTNIMVNLLSYGLTTITGNIFIAPAGGAAIKVGVPNTLGDGNSVTINGNVFDNFSTGVTLASTATKVTVLGNRFENTAQGNCVINNSVSLTHMVRDNFGFNPIGVSTQTIASGSTFSNGAIPGTAYISASTSISALLVNGTSILGSVTLGANVVIAIELGPNETFTPTYTGTLTFRLLQH